MTGHALEKARQEAEALATQFKNTERPTRAQAKVLESAKRAAEDLQAKYNRLTDSVKRQQRELAAVGINTRNLAHERNWPEIRPRWALPVWGLRRRERWPELSC